MHRGGGRGGSAGRTVSRPGVNTGDTASNFVSPWQPPPATLDLNADVIALDPNAWQLVHVAGYFWRVRPATPQAVAMLTAILETKGGAQVQAINTFLAAQLHPDDLRRMLERMMDPDDTGFDHDEYTELYRAAVTVGTARPFLQSSAFPELRLTRGGLFAPN